MNHFANRLIPDSRIEDLIRESDRRRLAAAARGEPQPSAGPGHGRLAGVFPRFRTKRSAGWDGLSAQTSVT
jgi:hypothetical protein